jgi:hypothetical protein
MFFEKFCVFWECENCFIFAEYIVNFQLFNDSESEVEVV